MEEKEERSSLRARLLPWKLRDRLLLLAILTIGLANFFFALLTFFSI